MFTQVCNNHQPWVQGGMSDLLTGVRGRVCISSIHNRLYYAHMCAVSHILSLELWLASYVDLECGLLSVPQKYSEDFCWRIVFQHCLQEKSVHVVARSNYVGKALFRGYSTATKGLGL